MKKISIMSIINVTDDSFSGDGIAHLNASKQLKKLKKALHDGADIIDIGAQSTRPGSSKIPATLEWNRIQPLIQAIKQDGNIPMHKISVDTFFPEIAKKALCIGVSIINNVSPASCTEIARLIAASNAKMIVMHSRNLGVDPKSDLHSNTPNKNPPSYLGTESEDNFLHNLIVESQELIQNALIAGAKKSQIIFDPGIGFGKNPTQNLEILHNLKLIKKNISHTLLIGASRKSFIPKLHRPALPLERLGGSLGAIAAALPFVDIVRVHDTFQTAQFLTILNAQK